MMMNNDKPTTLEQWEKEYDILDSIVDLKDTVIADIRKENAELKAENERLKEEINKLGKKHEDYCNTMYWQMKEQMDKYRSALQEIKAIAENREIFCENCSFCCDDFTCDDCGYVKILQKITKAESEE